MYIPVWALIVLVFVIAGACGCDPDPGPVYDRNGLRRRKD